MHLPLMVSLYVMMISHHLLSLTSTINNQQPPKYTMSTNTRVSYGAFLSYLRLKMDTVGGIFTDAPSWISDFHPIHDEDKVIVGNRIQLTEEFLQMMFVSGETGEPSAETTTLIESIVQDQVKEMVRIGNSSHFLFSTQSFE